MPEYSVKFEKDFNQHVRQTIASKNPAKDESDLIGRAIALYSYLHEEVNSIRGARIAVIDKDDKIIRIIDPLP